MSYYIVKSFSRVGAELENLLASAKLEPPHRLGNVCIGLVYSRNYTDNLAVYKARTVGREYAIRLVGTYYDTYDVRFISVKRKCCAEMLSAASFIILSQTKKKVNPIFQKNFQKMNYCATLIE